MTNITFLGILKGERERYEKDRKFANLKILDAGRSIKENYFWLGQRDAFNLAVTTLDRFIEEFKKVALTDEEYEELNGWAKVYGLGYITEKLKSLKGDVKV